MTVAMVGTTTQTDALVAVIVVMIYVTVVFALMIAAAAKVVIVVNAVAVKMNCVVVATQELLLARSCREKNQDLELRSYNCVALSL